MSLAANCNSRTNWQTMLFSYWSFIDHWTRRAVHAWSFESLPIHFFNNVFYTVSTQQYIITVIKYIQSGHITATCFDRKRSSSGQWRTFLRCNKLAWRWPFTVETCSHNVTWLYILYHCNNIVVYWRYIIHYTNLLIHNGMVSVKNLPMLLWEPQMLHFVLKHKKFWIADIIEWWGFVMNDAARAGKDCNAARLKERGACCSGFAEGLS